MMWTWLILAAVLLAVEMMTGTLALLFVSFGALVAALLAYILPDSIAAQIGVFALAIIVGAVIAWRRIQSQRARAPADPNASVEEIGQQVEVVVLPDAQAHLRVRYRGCEWAARLANKDLAVETGMPLTIVAQESSMLIVDADPHQPTKE
ncbi:MAG: NfeD family protein [Zoogloeaceae bacterium]|jgi:membrane protein implicated in regulation of membrane protease activity|nr:NfeD family protein [Zoogloeaceae bacterium]